MADENDFTITDGVLVKYNGEGGDIVIPDCVKAIGEDAFSRCAGLTNVIIQEGVTIIGRRAFEDCDNLSTVTIPKSVTKIDKDAFHDCKIDSLNHKLLKIKDGCALSGDGMKLLYCADRSKTNITIPEGVTVIEKDAFFYSYKLKNIKIPVSVAAIGEDAFNYEYLTSIEYSGSSKEWGKISFDKKPEKTIARKLIKDFAIQQEKNEKMTQINEVTAEGFMNAMVKSYPDFKYFILKTSAANFTTFIMKGKNGAIVQLTSNFEKLSKTFPKFIEAFGDESKSNDEIYALFAEHKIKIAEIKQKDPQVEIECNVLVLFAEAFNCVKDTNNLSIFSKSKIKSFSFGHCTSISQCAFANCNEIENIAIPKGITAIEGYTFSRCTNLTNVTIPESITSIESFAFHNCSALKNITFQGSKEQWDKISIGDWNDNLKEMTIKFEK